MDEIMKKLLYVEHSSINTYEECYILDKNII